MGNSKRLVLIFALLVIGSVFCQQNCDSLCDKTALEGFAQASWTTVPASWFVGDPCSGWSGVLCSGSPARVVSVAISGFKGRIPSQLSQMYYLQSFELLGAGLSQALPPELSTLQQLTQFVVRMSELNVGLSGSLPVEYSAWNNLEHFEFYCPTYEPFKGTLPAQWSSWQNLRYMEVSGCLQNGGNLPESWATFNNLVHLDLRSNSLAGSLPKQLSTAQYLEYFDVSSNAKLSSSLPIEYSTFSNISYFSVANNKISGEISPYFSTWENLEFFSVQNNKFSGTLSKFYSTWGQISYLRAGTNLFSGTLPREWSAWGNITEFQIPYNLFSGTVPTELAHAWTGLRQLDISQNKRICGEVSDKLLKVGGVRSIIGTNIEGWCIGQTQPVSWVLIVVSIVVGSVVLCAIIGVTWCTARATKKVVRQYSRRRIQVAAVGNRRQRRRQKKQPASDGQGDYQNLPYEPPVIIQSSNASSAPPF